MEDLTIGAVYRCVLCSHSIFLKTFALATSGLEVRMQDWQAGFVVSIISPPQFYLTRVNAKQCGLLEREFYCVMALALL